MNEEPFRFKEFSVIHHLCAHKVGFDGVLLGAWANVSNNKKILDACAGSGVIGLMTAQKNKHARITGIEIDNNSVKQGIMNYKNSPFPNLMNMHHINLNEFMDDEGYDHVLINPPYFIDSLNSADEKSSFSKHISKDDLWTLLNSCKNLLSENGKLSLIMPYQFAAKTSVYLGELELFASRKWEVYTSKSDPERILAEYSGKLVTTEKKKLNVFDTEGNYSQEYINLTKAFYLNF